MNSKIQKYSNSLVGSQAYMAEKEGMPLAATWVNVDALVLCDISASMNMTDSRGGKSRHEELKNQLKIILEKYQGKVAVYVFSVTCLWVPDGKIPDTEAWTDLTNALRVLLRDGIDNLGIPIMLLSDGEPDNPETALSMAKNFKTKIDTIYIGPEDEIEAIKFMKDLAKASGGAYTQNFKLTEKLLSDQVGTLLLSDGSTPSQSGPIAL